MQPYDALLKVKDKYLKLDEATKTSFQKYKDELKVKLNKDFNEQLTKNILKTQLTLHWTVSLYYDELARHHFKTVQAFEYFVKSVVEVPSGFEAIEIKLALYTIGKGGKSYFVEYTVRPTLSQIEILKKEFPVTALLRICPDCDSYHHHECTSYTVPLCEGCEDHRKHMEMDE